MPSNNLNIIIVFAVIAVLVYLLRMRCVATDADAVTPTSARFSVTAENAGVSWYVRNYSVAIATLPVGEYTGAELAALITRVTNDPNMTTTDARRGSKPLTNKGVVMTFDSAKQQFNVVSTSTPANLYKLPVPNFIRGYAPRSYAVFATDNVNA